MEPVTNPRVGVGVFILQNTNNPEDPTFIMGKRQGSHGSGTWALPGGHLEFGESFEDCSAREIMEETGLRIKNIKYLTATNDIMLKEGKHYITIFMVCERDDSDGTKEPELLEPNKCLQWKWVRWSEMKHWAGREQQHLSTLSSSTDTNLPADITHRLFSPMRALLEQRSGVVPA